MDREEIAAERRKVLRNVKGVVLELGFGTGHNLPFYPEEVERVVAVDPSATSAKLARHRILAAPFPVECRNLTAEGIDAPDRAFDTVVSTYTLCTVPDPTRALAQVRRVLKPGGSFHLLEHGLADDPKVQRWQARLNFLHDVFLGGCQLNRDIEGLVRGAGFTFDRVDKYYIATGPKFSSWMTRGVARLSGPG